MHKTEEVSGVTNALGALTAYSEFPIVGRVVAVFMDYVDGATGGDPTITAEDSGAAIFSRTNAGVSDIVQNLGLLQLDEAGAAIVAASAPGVPLIGERIKLVVVQGGDAKTWKFRFLIEC